MSASRSPCCEAPRSRYVALTALRWLPVGLLVPVYVRLMLDHGLDLATIGMVMIVYTVTVISLEIPTGGLADTIGAMFGARRRHAVAGHDVRMAARRRPHRSRSSASPWSTAPSALRSGPLEAWYVSDAVTHGRDDTVTRGVSLGAVAEAGGLRASPRCSPGSSRSSCRVRPC